MMDDFNTETDSDYTSYWRDWVSEMRRSFDCHIPVSFVAEDEGIGREKGVMDAWIYDFFDNKTARYHHSGSRRSVRSLSSA